MKKEFVMLMVCAGAVAAPQQPNFLLIIADDCTYRDLGTYGGQAHTPNLDRLAAEGMKFTRCFQAAPMCSPTRHSLYTGLYPVKSGAYPNHTEAYPWVKSIAHYLQADGYRTYLPGKTHIAPESVFPFEYSAQKKNPVPAALENALRASVESKKPFLFIAASNEPHEPWNKGDASAYPPASLKLPPVMVDSPDAREQYSKYLAEITCFDSQVGEFVGLVDRYGQRDNTFVIVLGEQGNSFPFAKWTCYDAGLQSGCIVRWPGKVKVASVSDALVEYVDVVPTFLDAAGIPRPDILDGRSFLPVLEGKTAAHKEYVFGLQTSRGIYAGPEFFGIRSIRNERYRYILNLTPDTTFQNTTVKKPYFKTWQKMAAEGDQTAGRLVRDYQHRLAEELYDCDADPWNRVNLIDNPEFAPVRNTLHAQLAAWMKQQGDEGQPTEMKAFERMPKKNKGEPEE